MEEDYGENNICLIMRKGLFNTSFVNKTTLIVVRLEFDIVYNPFG
jgi:hypothetical protein